nr:hypothetical protein [Angustibacter aerolatus]
MVTDEPRWLDADERAAWLALTRLTSRLPGALDAQARARRGPEPTSSTSCWRCSASRPTARCA